MITAELYRFSVYSHLLQCSVFWDAMQGISATGWLFQQCGRNTLQTLFLPSLFPCLHHHQEVVVETAQIFQRFIVAEEDEITFS